jgi:hypothetical protein
MKFRKLSQEITLQFCVRKVPVSNLDRDTCCPTKVSCYPLSLQEVSRENHAYFYFLSHSLFRIIEEFGATASLNKPKIINVQTT